MAAASVVGVGIIGLGSIGTTHARAVRAVGGAALRAFSGGSPSRAAHAGWPDAVQVPAAAVATHPEVDVVVVCSPSGDHAEHTLAALAAGCDVVVEKPLAVRVADAEKIVAVAAERGARVAMMSQRRFEPQHRVVKELLDSGTLGRLRLATTHVHSWRDEAYFTSAAWRASSARGGGSLLNQGVHNVDLLRWLAGDVEEVTAQNTTQTSDLEAEDTTVATVRFASGALGLVSTSTATPPGFDATITLHTDRGRVELGQGRVLRWEIDGVAAPDAADDAFGSGAADPAAIGVAGHVTQWRDFLRARSEGRPPAVGAADAAETVRLLCAISEAAATGRAVRPAAL